MEVPKPGDVIYVDSDYFLFHGCDDFVGGKATVSRVWTELIPGRPTVYVETVEHRGTYYSWPRLAKLQAELAELFGDTWSHPEPDWRPEFNEPW